MVTVAVLSILIAFAALRRLIEPSCPACSAKTWGEGSRSLNCASCGWTSAAGDEPEQSQYEMSLLEQRTRDLAGTLPAPLPTAGSLLPARP